MRVTGVTTLPESTTPGTDDDFMIAKVAATTVAAVVCTIVAAFDFRCRHWILIWSCIAWSPKIDSIPVTTLQNQP